MIKLKIDKGDVDIESDGNGLTIAAEAITIVRVLHETLTGLDITLGEIFKRVLTKMVADGSIFNEESDDSVATYKETDDD